MEQLVINQEIEKILPKLDKEEFDNLEKSVIREGCRDDLVVWDYKNKLVLIDGYNRYKICKKNNIEFKIKKLNFENVLAVKIWIQENQLSRRNLTDEQRTYLIGTLYKDMKLQQGGSKKAIDGEKTNDNTTAETLGKKFDTSEKSVRRAEEFADAVDKVEENLGKKVKDKILNGEIEGTKKDIVDLADKSEKVQKKVVEKITEGKAKNIKEAVEKVEGKKKESKKETNTEKIFNKIKEKIDNKHFNVYNKNKVVVGKILDNSPLEFSEDDPKEIPSIVLQLKHGSEIEVNILDFNDCFEV